MIIHITDISKLKFTKVKPWKIYFKYEDTEYMILDSNPGENSLSLYKRHKLKNGNHTVEHIKRATTNLKPYNMIRTVSSKFQNNIVYANIDKNYFVTKLLDLGFSSGYLEERQSIYLDKLNKVDIQIKSTQDKLDKLKKEKEELLKDKDNIRCLASKKANENIIKRKLAERVQGKQDGEWCEEYKCFYGESHEVYGGKLVDLYNLPVGTFFNVANGAWDGVIGYDNDGDKCVVTGHSSIKLTSQHHSLYLNIKD